MYVHAKSVESVAALMTLVVTISLVGTTIIIWDSDQLNHPYGTFSKFPEQVKEK